MVVQQCIRWLREWEVKLSADLRRWRCQNCDTWNEATAKRCEVCDSPGQSGVVEVGGFTFEAARVRLWGDRALRAASVGLTLVGLHFLIKHNLVSALGSHLRQYFQGGGAIVLIGILGASAAASLKLSSDFVARILYRGLIGVIVFVLLLL